MSLADIGRVTLVGAGKMGLAMARGWIEAGLKGKALVLVDPQPSEDALTFAQSSGAVLVSALTDGAGDVLVLAVKPQIADKVFGPLRPHVGPHTLVISIAAGLSLKRLAEGFGTDRIVRAMPNTPAQIGQGISGAVPGTGVVGTDMARAEALMQAAGPLVWFGQESDIDAVTAVSGSGPAYVFALVEAMAAAGAAEGLSGEAAMALARQTVIGAAALMAADASDAATLRKNVTSPGGTTQAALDVLKGADGLDALMARAIHAARLRSVELGK